MNLSIEIVLPIDQYDDFVNSSLYAKMQQATQGLPDPTGGVFRVAYGAEQPQTQVLTTFQLPGLLFIDLDRSVVVGKAAVGNLSTVQLRSLIEQYLNLEYDPQTGTYLDTEDGSIVPIQEGGSNFLPGFGLFNFNLNLPPIAWLVLAGVGGYKAYTSKKQLIQTIGAAGAIVGMNQYLKTNIGLSGTRCKDGTVSNSSGSGTCSWHKGVLSPIEKNKSLSFSIVYDLIDKVTSLVKSYDSTSKSQALEILRKLEFYAKNDKTKRIDIYNQLKQYNTIKFREFLKPYGFSYWEDGLLVSNAIDTIDAAMGKI